MVRYRAHGGILMQSKALLELTHMGIEEGLYSGNLVGCVSLKFVLLTQTNQTIMGNNHKKILSHHKRRKE